MVGSVSTNRKRLAKLLAFMGPVVELCNGVGVRPVVYGSYAYLIYTGDPKAVVNDIDLLVPGASLEKIRDALRENEILCRYYPGKTLHVFKDKLKIEIDSCENWSIDISASKRLDSSSATFS